MPGLGSHPGLSMSIGIALITRGFAFVGAGEIQISVSQPFMVTSGDFDGNGLPDFAVSSLFANSVGILLNDGKGGFLPQLTRVTYFPHVLNREFASFGRAHRSRRL